MTPAAPISGTIAEPFDAVAMGAPRSTHVYLVPDALGGTINPLAAQAELIVTREFAQWSQKCSCKESYLSL
ncbi:MAG: hypothetical protein EOO82_01560 [Oxalobacteraceae bacterium]|nr:MAG: hypothetical protein EOO82_01560 [Oxalobacteraceae bacterium]